MLSQQLARATANGVLSPLSLKAEALKLEASLKR